MIKGALRSKTVWFNAFVVFVGALAASGEAFRELIDPTWFPAVVSFIGAVNLALRSVTNQSLEDKGNA